MGIHPKKIYDEDCGSDSDERLMTGDELADYCKQISESENETPGMEFVKVLKAMCMICDIVWFYITFEANDVAAGGQTKTYQAVVRQPPPRRGYLHDVFQGVCARARIMHSWERMVLGKSDRFDGWYVYITT